MTKKVEVNVMKFKVGDKVRVTGVTDGKRKKYNGKEIVIKSINPNGTERYSTHYDAENCCYIFLEGELEPVNKKKIIITSDGKETLARLYDGYEVIKSAIAKCSPEETFDFETGARIAFDRLVGEKPVEEKPKYYNGKVVCVESVCSRLLTKGKIYTIIDGEFTFDKDGKVYEIKSFEDLSDRFESKFVELVE